MNSQESEVLYWITRSYYNNNPNEVTLKISTIKPLSDGFYDKLQILLSEELKTTVLV